MKNNSLENTSKNNLDTYFEIFGVDKDAIDFNVDDLLKLYSTFEIRFGFEAQLFIVNKKTSLEEIVTTQNPAGTCILLWSGVKDQDKKLADKYYNTWVHTYKYSYKSLLAVMLYDLGANWGFFDSPSDIVAMQGLMEKATNGKEWIGAVLNSSVLQSIKLNALMN